MTIKELTQTSNKFQNDSFKNGVYEASAGTYKFTGVADTKASNDAVANKILVFGEDGKVKVKEITPSWARGRIKCYSYRSIQIFRSF